MSHDATDGEAWKADVGTVAVASNSALLDDSIPSSGPGTRLDGLDYGPLKPNGGGGGGSPGLVLPPTTTLASPSSLGGYDDQPGFQLPTTTGEQPASNGQKAIGANNSTVNESVSTASISTNTNSSSSGTTHTDSNVPTGKPSFQGSLTDQPVRFVSNAGQWGSGIDFGVQGNGYQAWISPNSSDLDLAGSETPKQALSSDAVSAEQDATHDTVQLT